MNVELEKMPLRTCCPRCYRSVFLPEIADADAWLRCPLCQSTYLLKEARDYQPPMLEIVSGPDAAFAADVAAADDLGEHRNALSTASTMAGSTGFSPTTDFAVEDIPGSSPNFGEDFHLADSSLESRSIEDQDTEPSISFENASELPSSISNFNPAEQAEPDSALNLEPAVNVRPYPETAASDRPRPMLLDHSYERSRRQKNPFVEIAKVVLGGVAGLAIGYLGLIWYMKKDWLPPSAEYVPAFLLPENMRQARADASSLNATPPVAQPTPPVAAYEPSADSDQPATLPAPTESTQQDEALDPMVAAWVAGEPMDPSLMNTPVVASNEVDDETAGDVTSSAADVATNAASPAVAEPDQSTNFLADPLAAPVTIAAPAANAPRATGETTVSPLLEEHMQESAQSLADALSEDTAADNEPAGNTTEDVAATAEPPFIDFSPVEPSEYEAQATSETINSNRATDRVTSSESAATGFTAANQISAGEETPAVTGTPETSQVDIAANEPATTPPAPPVVDEAAKIAVDPANEPAVTSSTASVSKPASSVPSWLATIMPTYNLEQVTTAQSTAEEAYFQVAMARDSKQDVERPRVKLYRTLCRLAEAVTLPGADVSDGAGAVEDAKSIAEIAVASPDDFNGLADLSSKWLHSTYRKESGVMLIGHVRSTEMVDGMHKSLMELPGSVKAIVYSATPPVSNMGERAVVLGVIVPASNAPATTVEGEKLPAVWGSHWLYPHRMRDHEE